MAFGSAWVDSTQQYAAYKLIRIRESFGFNYFSYTENTTLEINGLCTVYPENSCVTQKTRNWIE